MTGNGRLSRTDGVRQLADAQFALFKEQKQTAQTYFVCDGGV